LYDDGGRCRTRRDTRFKEYTAMEDSAKGIVIESRRIYVCGCEGRAVK